MATVGGWQLPLPLLLLRLVLSVPNQEVLGQHQQQEASGREQQEALGLHQQQEASGREQQEALGLHQRPEALGLPEALGWLKPGLVLVEVLQKQNRRNRANHIRTLNAIPA